MANPEDPTKTEPNLPEDAGLERVAHVAEEEALQQIRELSLIHI